ncbi:MAG: translation factor GTPase family protein [Lachnospiraceae bacterium]|nr:translation factor GTPase family protein [Lachnospiraceae bacterium]
MTNKGYGENMSKKPSNDICIGLLAHVDAGKTTLSEAMLYTGGSIRKLGRVDNKDAFLDTYELERARGITIFSKQAVLKMNDLRITLLDTPGHVDFSAEMERTLQVLDYGILVISGADGVQGHTQTLWRLLKKYHIPVFLLINKMDQNGTDKEALMLELKQRLDEGCIDFTDDTSEDFYDEIAMTDESAMEAFLENGIVDEERIKRLIRKRRVFPCYFGSALKMTGVKELMDGYMKYMERPVYGDTFGARVYKISRDAQGNRLTHMKITGGTLKARQAVFTGTESSNGSAGSEKVNQIRIYSGEKFEAVSEAGAGSICAVTGLSKTKAGEGLGAESASDGPLLEPVLTYRIELPEGYDPAQMLPKLRQLEEEAPELHIVWNEQLKEIQAQLMGEVQIEVLQSMIAERFGISVTFGTGHIVYRETISDCVEGVGHFEPLRHYAEVYLVMEPAAPGSGIILDSICSEDMLDKNWQRLIMTHLREKEHVGVLTGSPLTDVKITLASGRAHLKHTEGGDFRQATYRAVRQGLMEAHSVLLEPYYEFRLEVPENMVGRAMTDLENMHADFQAPEHEGEMTVLYGQAPVSEIKDYQKEVIAYSKGHGKIFFSFKGYFPCHNADEVIAAMRYEAERDTDHPAGSVFCAHGAGFNVPWNEVKSYMHLESAFRRFGAFYGDGSENGSDMMSAAGLKGKSGSGDISEDGQFYEEEAWIDTEEVDSILERTFYANRKADGAGKWTRQRRKPVPQTATVYTYKATEPKEEYLLVDGYNIIYAWEELNDMMKDNIDGARDSLMDILCNYQAMRQCHLMVVFDAYKVKGNVTTVSDYKNIRVVYTKEAETADQYIEKFAHENAKKYRITVATSDGLEQIIIRSKGCALLSARDLKEEIRRTGENLRKDYMEKQEKQISGLFDGVSAETLKQVEKIPEE